MALPNIELKNYLCSSLSNIKSVGIIKKMSYATLNPLVITMTMLAKLTKTRFTEHMKDEDKSMLKHFNI